MTYKEYRQRAYMQRRIYSSKGNQVQDINRQILRVRGFSNQPSACYFYAIRISSWGSYSHTPKAASVSASPCPQFSFWGLVPLWFLTGFKFQGQNRHPNPSLAFDSASLVSPLLPSALYYNVVSLVSHASFSFSLSPIQRSQSASLIFAFLD